MSAGTRRRNRVDPAGELHATAARGTLMGNRGILHEGQDIVRPWATKAWVTCVLDATFQKRTPFSPGTYSELFLLDEATAFAAGHRPCRTCQRQRHDHFNIAWTAANRPGAGVSRLPIADIDKALHAERTLPSRGKRSFTAKVSDLPDGTIFLHGGQPSMVWRKAVHAWSFDGYTRGSALPPGALVEVLTPASIVQLFRAGFRPRVHPSADATDLS
jgi:hypothetical protein